MCCFCFCPPLLGKRCWRVQAVLARVLALVVAVLLYRWKIDPKNAHAFGSHADNR
jgi:hypothetical protein